jgi:hypothetical protein
VSLRNRFLEIRFEDFTEAELALVIKAKLPPATRTADTEAAALARFYHLANKEGITMTMREVEKIVRRRSFFAAHGSAPTWATVLSTLLALRDDKTAPQLAKLFSAVPALGANNVAVATIATRGEECVLLSESGITVELKIGGQSSFGPTTVEQLATSLFCARRNKAEEALKRSVDAFRQPLQLLARVAAATSLGEPVLLVGPSSIKSRLVETWAAVAHPASDPLISVPLTPDIEVSDLVGELRPYSFHEQLKYFGELIANSVIRARALRRKRLCSLPPPVTAEGRQQQAWEESILRYFGHSVRQHAGTRSSQRV